MLGLVSGLPSAVAVSYCRGLRWGEPSNNQHVWHIINETKEKSTFRPDFIADGRLIKLSNHVKKELNYAF